MWKGDDDGDGDGDGDGKRDRDDDGGGVVVTATIWRTLRTGTWTGIWFCWVLQWLVYREHRMRVYRHWISAHHHQVAMIAHTPHCF